MKTHKQTELSKTDLAIQDLWLKNYSMAQIALQTGKTIAQVATSLTKLQKLSLQKEDQECF